MMLAVTVTEAAIQIGAHFRVTFQRTLRIPDDGGTYPLPPGLGALPVRRVADFAEQAPADWREHGGVFIPMYQREALWLNFTVPHWHPCAVKVAVGKINAITGKDWTEQPASDPQDYVVCPEQPWLDGINAGAGFIRQFVAMPLGQGYSVEGQITGKETFGGLQLLVFAPRPGRFPDEPPPVPHGLRETAMMMAPPAPVMTSAAMGLAAGGRMEQKIYPDEYGIATWDQKNSGQVYVHIVNSLAYQAITGEAPPPSPVSARTYTEYGFPWFALYDEAQGDLSPSDRLASVKSVKEMDQQKDLAPQQDDNPVEVATTQIKTVGPKTPIV
jgi:hypothetical protein